MDDSIPGVDVALIELFGWLKDNCSDREKDLIYLACNFSKAYLIKRKKEAFAQLNENEKQLLSKINKIIEAYNCPNLSKRETFTKYNL